MPNIVPVPVAKIPNSKNSSHRMDYSTSNFFLSVITPELCLFQFTTNQEIYYFCCHFKKRTQLFLNWISVTNQPFYTDCLVSWTCHLLRRVLRTTVRLFWLATFPYKAVCYGSLYNSELRGALGAGAQGRYWCANGAQWCDIGALMVRNGAILVM